MNNFIRASPCLCLQMRNEKNVESVWPCAWLVNRKPMNIRTFCFHCALRRWVMWVGMGGSGTRKKKGKEKKNPLMSALIIRWSKAWLMKVVSQVILWCYMHIPLSSSLPSWILLKSEEVCEGFTIVWRLERIYHIGWPGNSDWLISSKTQFRLPSVRRLETHTLLSNWRRRRRCGKILSARDQDWYRGKMWK